MTIRAKEGKTYALEWCSSAISPRELWIRLPDRILISQAAPDFDGCDVFETDDGFEKAEYRGYTRLTNAMLDEGGLTLRISKA